MALDAYDRSLDLIRALAPLLQALVSSDPDLAKQMRRAAASIPLNIAEADQRVGKDRKHLFRIALGSAAEVTACLDTAAAFGYFGPERTTEALALLDRVRAMTFRLAR